MLLVSIGFLMKILIVISSNVMMTVSQKAYMVRGILLNNQTMKSVNNREKR